MFQFPGLSASRPMRSGGAAWALPQAGSPIRRSADRGPCAPPRGLSQLVTSFFDFLCQGIHRVPLISSSRRARRRAASISGIDHTNIRDRDCESPSNILVNVRDCDDSKMITLCDFQGARPGVSPVRPGSAPLGGAPWKPDAAKLTWKAGMLLGCSP